MKWSLTCDIIILGPWYFDILMYHYIYLILLHDIFFYSLTYITFISIFCFLLSFKSIYQQTTYRKRENHFSVLTSCNIINHISKQRKPPGLYFFQNESNMNAWVHIFHIYNISSKVFLNKPHTKIEKITWMWWHTF